MHVFVAAPLSYCLDGMTGTGTLRETDSSDGNPRASNQLFDFPSGDLQNGSGSLKAKPTSGGVTASTEMLAAKRHAGVHTPVIECKMIIANQQMAYAA